MTPEQYTAARNAYRYVPARLQLAGQNQNPDLIWRGVRMWGDCLPTAQWQQPETRAGYSSMALDKYHMDLLNSEHDDDMLRGLASSVFWGYASGQAGRHTPGRALARANMLAQGRNGPRAVAAQNPADVLMHLRQARQELKNGNPGAALGEAMKIQFLGMSFASKLLMFLDPARAAVYDSVIAELLKTNESPELRKMAIGEANPERTLLGRRMDAYRRWCDFCVTEAAELNAQGSCWTDWNEDKSSWRAVDIERAFFAGS